MGKPLRLSPLAARVTQGIHRELKLWPEICLAPSQAVVQAWGTQVGLMLTGVLVRTSLCSGVPAQAGLFHSGFYKNCVTTEIEQCKSDSLTRNKYLPF